MSKFLPIIQLVLSVIALVLTVVVLLQVGGIKKAIANPEDENAENVEVGSIPLSQLKEFNMPESFIYSFPSETNPGKNLMISLKIGFAINTEDEDAGTVETVLTDQGRIIRDRIHNLVRSKDASYFTDLNKQTELKGEILVLVQGLLGNQAVVDVYFDPIISEK